jgi:(S)-mandelate dehydrogenase
MLLHPHWMRSVFLRGLPEFGNLAEFLPPGQRGLASAGAWSRREVDPDIDWALAARLRALWPGKLVIKGLLSPKDAVRSREIGADAVVLSNHGGRQLDGAVSPMRVLPEIAAEIGRTMAVFVDSGFRRGTDVVKALALGADGVLVGRPAAYGLAAAGQSGAERALDLIGEEISRTLALLGYGSLDALDAGCLVSGDAGRRAEKI